MLRTKKTRIRDYSLLDFDDVKLSDLIIILNGLQKDYDLDYDYLTLEFDQINMPREYDKKLVVCGHRYE